jgi:hypothetical protein
MTNHLQSRKRNVLALIAGLATFSVVAQTAPVYLECQTADSRGKKVKVMTFTLDEEAQTVSGALGVMEGAFTGLSPEAERNLDATSSALGGEKARPTGSNLRTPQTRRAVFSVNHVEFSLLQPSGGEALAVAFSISRVDLSITEKYALMKVRTGTCKLVEPVKRAF